MRTINVSIGHDDDFVIAHLIDVEVVTADASAKGGNKRADLIGRQHLVKTSALYIQNLTAQRQDRLV